MSILATPKFKLHVKVTIGKNTRNLKKAFLAFRQLIDQLWRAPIGWFGLNVSALSAFGPSERCFPVQADDSPMNCAA